MTEMDIVKPAALSVACFATALLLPQVAAAQDFGIPPLDQVAAETHCGQKWTEAGILDTEMFDFCMREQQEGHDEALALATQYDGELVRDIVPYAVRKWLQGGEYEFSMVAFEIKEQMEALSAVIDGRGAGIFSDADLKACMSKWLTPEEPLWDMVQFCLKEG